MRSLDKLWWWRPTTPNRIALPRCKCSFALLAGLMLLCSSLSVAHAGPVIRPRRMMREIYGEITDANAQNVTNFIADTCLYDGSQVSRSSITCEKKHGCRAIQKTGECCPDYQCECQRDGKIYANGEKVIDPETPCRVCYCQGGEITCSQVSCYKRHDCEPKFIPGRCCPEYDNCPPIENSNIAEPTSSGDDQSSELKETDIDSEDLLDAENKKLSSITSNDVTTAGTTSTSTTTSTTEGSITAKVHVMNNNPLGLFKIKEITKPEEIRLTDSRPKITTTTVASSSSGNDNAAQPSTESSSTHGEEANHLEHLDLNVTDDGEDGTKNVRHTDEDGTLNGTSEITDSGESSTVGASESASSTSDEMEASSESSTSTTTTTVRVFVPSTPSTTTIMPDDVSDEVTKKDKPLPAVVQIGDKLVIVDHNQPKPITVIQVEEVAGLQRGEDDISYDQEMYTDRAPDSRETPKQMKLESSEGDTLSTQADSSMVYETVYHGGSTENLASEEVFETQHYTEGPESSAEKNDTQSDQLSASSEEFIQLTPSSDKPGKLDEEHTTLNSLATSAEEGSTTMTDFNIMSASSEASGDEVYETHFYTEGPGSSSETTEVAGNALSESAETTKPGKDLPVDDMATQRKPYIEDDEHDLIQPGFQPIPEDFSLPLRDQPAMDDEMEPSSAPAKSERKENIGTPKILSDVFEYRQNTTSTTTETASEGDNEVTISPSWLKDEAKPMLRAPGEPHLVPEWERRNVTISNATSDEKFSETGDFHVLKMNSEEYFDSSSEGSGSSSSRKEPEETTLAPTKLLLHDIDSAESTSSSESDSLKHNPKNDVESVKYDEDENSSAQDALPKQVKSSV